MNADAAIDLARQAVSLTLVLSLPVLLTVLAVGLVVSLLQAITQVQEQTLSFVPKLLAGAAAILLAGPWALERLIEFSRAMFGGGW
ncbi:MAG: Flagellar biosynthetic protein FliQ [Planctomycetes bacterium ADurb.Bin126]|nr:MAG: Flagellar biosynthetic protein FliQ [Planctomycetes bacterium ADurb.Bin126]HQL75017.1 flagellar biosynthesis protein FliQ [Phycisphaerae bacterium]